jgi:hypothetical protein
MKQNLLVMVRRPSSRADGFRTVQIPVAREDARPTCTAEGQTLRSSPISNFDLASNFELRVSSFGDTSQII